MTHRFASIGVVIIAVIAWGYPAPCRAAPPADPVPRGMTSGYSVPLGGLDMLKIHDATDRDRAIAKKESSNLLNVLQLSCAPTDAALIGRGKADAKGGKVAVEAYEVACANHLGYILLSQGAQMPIAISCFAAAAKHAAATAQDTSDLYCDLPPNKDLKAMASSLMTATGTDCAVSNLRWFGLNESSHTDYSEVSCADGNGFLLKVPQAGPSAQVSVVSCQEAARQGLKCRLTDAGPVAVPVTMQTFRDALTRNAVNCQPVQLRLIGRESLSRRYVVEAQCPEQPHGLVAFIPVADNAGLFETIDCTAAGERQIRCEFPFQ